MNVMRKKNIQYTIQNLTICGHPTKAQFGGRSLPRPLLIEASLGAWAKSFYFLYLLV